ncbi:MAG: ABC transporter permease [Bdellovibrionales bacterium]|nr:ABC transporter permease [Bdellovibrionales bacterium]
MTKFFDQYVEPFVSSFGRIFVSLFNASRVALEEMGRMLRMLWASCKLVVTPPVRWQLIVDQMQFIGVGSLFIVVLTAIFSGMVFALQSGRAFAIFGAETLTGAVVTITLSRELAPVLTALMVTARSGSAMAAQIGTMQVTQQIEALSAMAVNPIDYLIAPRIVAAILVMPMLTSIFDFVGLLGAYIVSTKLLNIDPAMFMEKIRYYVDVADIVQGLFKSIFFAVILSLVSCYQGLQAQKGAYDVGRRVTMAVVISSVAILVADYFLTALLF